MLMRMMIAAGAVAIVIFGLLTWRQNAARVERAAVPEASAPPGGSFTLSGEPATPGAPVPPHDVDVVGVDWVVPRSWIRQISGGMRLATYIVPGTTTATDAECAVYHFGPGQGGGIEANLDRWSGEFESIDRQDGRRSEISGLKLATIELSGTFAGHTMQPGKATGPRPKWGMLGAIVGGPKGDVFFKLTGPAATIDHAKPAFEEMLSSLHTH
ncbi:MAG: hypothetical protein ABIS67_07280 [Candidatus Eisenbacteria bacterium]